MNFGADLLNEYMFFALLMDNILKMCIICIIPYKLRKIAYSSQNVP